MPRPNTAGDTPFWVLQQHDRFSVVQSAEPPPLKVADGLRQKLRFGPYRTEADAKDAAAKMYSRTMRSQLEGLPMEEVQNG